MERAADIVCLPAIDEASFAKMYDREFGFVWHGLRRMGIQTRDLPDLTHDVFLTVYRSLERYDPTRPLRPWLSGVIFRVAADHIRLARSRNELLHAQEEPEVADERPALDDAYAARQEWQLVDAALRQLSVPQRTVLVLYDFLGNKGHEVAEVMNVPLKTVFSRLRVARERLLELVTSMRSDAKGAPRPRAVRGA